MEKFPQTVFISFDHCHRATFSLWSAPFFPCTNSLISNDKAVSILRLKSKLFLGCVKCHALCLSGFQSSPRAPTALLILGILLTDPSAHAHILPSANCPFLSSLPAHLQLLTSQEAFPPLSPDGAPAPLWLVPLWRAPLLS